jgi:hypothetical protein
MKMKLNEKKAESLLARLAVRISEEFDAMANYLEGDGRRLAHRRTAEALREVSSELRSALGLPIRVKAAKMKGGLSR